jgi:tRNA pseudouridine32 synthase / 23S rRNA pseudouridine746 synthase
MTSVNYWYEGRCPYRGELLRLPRTEFVEAIAHDLMDVLRGDERFSHEGKMYGVLLVETASGERYILKAFSGLLNGESDVEGWVPSIPGRDRVALEEAQTLGLLESIKQEMIQLHRLSERQKYEELGKQFEIQLQALSQVHQKHKQRRQQKRQETTDHDALEALDEESRQDGIERRRLKQQRDRVLQPLKQAIEEADLKIQALKRRRKVLSQKLQNQMNAAYRLTNFAGESRSLQDLLSTMPTGTGECCAPKLLHYAATQGFKPLAMAEFWWGSASRDKVQGEFYGACLDRCQPIIGFLLSGLPQPQVNVLHHDLSIAYEDDFLIVVDKPSGLLSVPGRYRHTQDNVLSKLQSSQLWAVHRLDQDTSGLLIIAKDIESHRKLNHQFQQRQVQKVYEAVLAGTVAERQGTIDLPLWSDPDDRPLQKVDWKLGKSSLTHFRVIATEANITRVQFNPVTGRTHQLRVHAAVGLGAPILGDRLYGNGERDRLYLHARELQFNHPHSDKQLHLKAETPF